MRRKQDNKGTEFRPLQATSGVLPNGRIRHIVIGVERYAVINQKYLTLCGKTGDYSNSIKSGRAILTDCAECKEKLKSWKFIKPEQATIKWTDVLWIAKARKWYNIPDDKITDWVWLDQVFVTLNFHLDGLNNATKFISDHLKIKEVEIVDPKRVTLKQARILKKMKFDLDCDVIYKDGEYHTERMHGDWNSNAGLIYSIPLLIQAVDWLAEVKNIDCVAMPSYNAEGRIYFAMVTSIKDDKRHVIYIKDELSKKMKEIGLETYQIFETRYAALSAALDFALKITKQ